MIGIGAYAILTMRQWASRSALRAIIGIELDADRAVRLIERTGRQIEGIVQPDSYVGAWLTTWWYALTASVACEPLPSCPTCCPPRTSGGYVCCCVWGTLQLQERIRSLRVLQPVLAVYDGAAFAFRLATDEIKIEWQESLGRG